MRVFIIGFEGVERGILELIQRGVEEVLGGGTCRVLDGVLRIPDEAYNRIRRQYASELLLEVTSEYIMESGRKDYILLGVTDVDIYAPGMNYIFGLAHCSGRTAVISLFRLRPEFYGESSNRNLFLERAVKEAIHEIGHALGLKHCKNEFCVMYFSLHIGMTDRKSKFFCEGCLRKIKHIFRDNCIY